MKPVAKTGSLTLNVTLSHPEWKTRRSTLARWAKLAAEATLASEKVKGKSEISLMVADDAALRQLNHDFRGKDTPTNVLSFPVDDDDAGVGYLGDMAVSMDTLEREADEQGKDLKAHYLHLIVHSVLHLLGYDHMEEEDAGVMEAKEIDILQSLGIKNPYIL